MVPGSLGWGSSVFAATVTLAPSRAARKAIARPIPRLAPVIKSVRPFSPLSADCVIPGPPPASFVVLIPVNYGPIAGKSIVRPVDTLTFAPLCNPWQVTDLGGDRYG